MAIRQLSVFAENKPGSLLAVINILRDADIDIRAFSIADTQDFGIARLIVSDTDAAYEALSKAGCLASITNVAAVTISDRPGALSELLCSLAEKGHNVEYMYAFLTSAPGYACVVLRVEDVTEAEAIALEKGLPCLKDQNL